MSNLLKRVKKEGNPLIDGKTVTFVWKGKKAPYINLETNFFRPVKMERAGKNLWTHSLELPSDAYVEYTFSKKKHQSVIPDPYNSNAIDTGVGHDNHYFSMPDKVHTDLILKRPAIKRGKVTKHKITDPGYLPGIKRKVWFYHPPTKKPVPLLLVLDGKDYKNRGFIVNIVDNLIADGRIQPIAMAMIDNAGDYRMTEYNQGETMPILIQRALLPLAEKKLNLLDIQDNKGAYGVVGASQGGLMAVYAGLRLPDIFGKIIAQAGAFVPLKDNRPALIHILVDTLPVQAIKIWQDCGTFDFLIDSNREMQDQLRAKGYDLTYSEHSGGHNYTCWRDLLADALETMFGV